MAHGLRWWGQIDEIKTLRDLNKKKESGLQEEQRELERMEGTLRSTVEAAKVRASPSLRAALPRQGALMVGGPLSLQGEKQGALEESQRQKAAQVVGQLHSRSAHDGTSASQLSPLAIDSQGLRV